MNKCYRLVFDEARGMLVPVAELASARGKGRGRAQGGARVSAVALLVASLGSACWPFGTALAAAGREATSQAASLLPAGGRVVAGAAAIATPSADQMVIEQSSERAAIDWQSFDIGAGDAVQFVQPSSTAQALNRVVGLTGTTRILGKLTANGQVFIVNPQGVVFGRGAVVDTAALLATTHDIAPSAFMVHGASLLLSGGSRGAGLVDNEGSLNTTPGGWVALVGDRVSNSGRIDAPGGAVALAAGDEATLALANGQLVSVRLDRAVANAGVLDSGTIRATGAAGTGGGRVLISADTAQSLLGQAINITGVVQAGSGSGSGGRIAVDGGTGGAVSLKGADLTVSSVKGKGGEVSLTGGQVTLYDAQVNAGGARGGGTILAGGARAGLSLHGSTLNVASAAARGGTAVLAGSTVSVLEGSRIDASGAGGGGTVIVGGDKLGKVASLMRVTLANRTVVDGSSAIDISSSHGNGGFLETSGRSVEIAGTVIAHSHGASGQWLIDPDNLVVTNSGSSTATNASNTWTPVTGGGGSYVLDSALTGANVTLDASGDIYSDSNVVVNDTGYNLTLIAANVGIEGSWTARNLIFNQSATGGILGTVTGNVIAESGTLNDYSTGSITGTVTVDSGAVFSIYTNSSLARTLGNDFILNGGTVLAGGVDGIATGGTLTRSNGVEVINIFDASGTLNTSAWTASKTATYLLVGGGGGAGENWGGGGGAGGLLQGSASADNGSLSVNVGAGGAGGTGSTVGGNGGNTTFDGLSAEGGGGGAQASSNTSLTVGENGGSGGGGGGGGSNGSGGTGVAGQGYGGGTAMLSGGYPLPGGGGGAGAAGSNAGSSAAGAGGSGIASNLTGVDTYYAGGGGGGGYYCSTVNRDYGFGLGGEGGGGSGVKDARAAGQSGQANTGGGGGGGAGSAGAGGSGGSGIAVIASNIAGMNDVAMAGNTTVTLTGTVTLGAGTTSTFTPNISGVHLLATGVISGSGNLAKAGVGTLTLAANDSYAGTTTVTSGTLRVGDGGAAGSMGTGAVTVSGAMLAFDLTGNSTQGSSSQLVLNHAAVEVLGGNVTLVGSSVGGTAVSISGYNNMYALGGSLEVLGNGLDTKGVAVDFAAGTVLNSIGNVSLLGNLAGTTGGGRRSFLFNGNVTLNALDGGNLSLTSSISNVAPDVPFLQNASGVVATSGNVSLNVQSNADVWESPFDFVDGVGVWKFSSSAGTLTLNAPAAQSGYGSFGLSAAEPLTLDALSGGAIVVNGSPIYASGTSITGGAGSVLINTNVSLTGNLAIGGGAGTVTVAGVISGAYGLTQDSTGTTVLTGNNSYGTTTIGAGTLQVGNGGSGGSLGSGAVTDGTGLVFDLSGNLTESQVIGGTGSLTQIGSGVLTLAADNTYSGVTNISAGTVQVGDGGTTGTLGTGAVTDDGALIVNYGIAVNLSAVAVCTSGITGNGAFTALSTGSLGIDRAVNLSGGNAAVLLAAGSATAAGNVGGGDVSLTSPVSAGANGSVVIFSGDPNTAVLDAKLSGAGAATQYKTYDANFTAVGRAVPGARNFYYRNVDDVTVAGTVSATKIYDGNNNATGHVTVSGASVSESISDGNNISFANLAINGETFNSPHALGANGSAVTVAFGSTANFSANGANWAVAGLTVASLSGSGTIAPADLTVAATPQSKIYDGTDSAASLATVTGLASTDTLSNTALIEAYVSPHVLGIGGSTLNVAAALSNASFAAGSVGYITDYNVAYVTAAGTISPASLTITATPQSKIYDGTDSAVSLATVTGLASTDTLSNTALIEAYVSPHVLGIGGSTLNVAAPLSNASFVPGSVGHITDYNVAYVTAKGSVTPAILDIAPGSDFTLLELPMATLAHMTGKVPAGEGYASDYMPNVVNDGNLIFAGPDAGALTSLTGSGRITVEAGQTLTVTGRFSQATVMIDNNAKLIHSGGADAGLVHQVESGIGSVAWTQGEGGGPGSDQNASQGRISNLAGSSGQMDVQVMGEGVGKEKSAGSAGQGTLNYQISGPRGMPQSYGVHSVRPALCIHLKQGSKVCTPESAK
jgi:filamentous hemagglutinin family protein